MTFLSPLRRSLLPVCLLGFVGPAFGAEPTTSPASPAVDRFGQNTQMDYPDKVRDEADLMADVEREKAYYDAINPPARDPWGGLPGSGGALGLKKTGFFHVEQKGDRWHLVSPDGNLYYMLGVCVYAPGDDWVRVKGRPESVFEWLPPADGPFRTAYQDGGTDNFSFHLANQIRKYGKPYDRDSYQTRMVERLRKWGFNAGGPFSGPSAASKRLKYPYMISLPITWHGVTMFKELKHVFDPFDEKNRAAMDASFAKILAPKASEQVLIGYFINNEPHFEEVPRLIAKLDGSHAVKREFVGRLQEQYKSIDALNKAWGTTFASFDELPDANLFPKTAVAAADLQAMVEHFFETYYKLIADTFRRHDPNHMLLGNRFLTATTSDRRLLEIAGKYLDVMSVNYYTYGIDHAFLKNVHAWSGRPLLLSEYFYSCPQESGVPGPAKSVETQAMRGLGYRNYVEQTAATGFVIGSTWFETVDQSVLGRAHEGLSGENFNTGLIATSDRPYRPMLAHMMETNHTVYDVVLGKREAFAWDDPRFVVSATASRSVSIGRAVGPVQLDGTTSGYPGVPGEPISSQRMVSGADSGGVEATFRLCYDDQFLHVLVDVVDPTPMQNLQTGKPIWKGDGVELFIGSRDPDAGGPLGFGDHQVLLSAGQVDGQSQWHFVQADRQPDTTNVAVTPNVNGAGYRLQAAIPFATLGFTPQPGQTVRFDLAVDDSADGNRRLRQFMWSGNGRNAADRSVWGFATFR
ncbi:MAG TPA: sugar-binding protein [Tepidisphaeraceae bacterium]|jgi:hypothetical protein|nr:sugar-binding protein [Tepidisphaeraceae bacterium]